MKTKRKRRTISEEIADTKSRDPHETVVITVSITRALYLHAMLQVGSGDYGSLSNFVSDLIRTHKHGAHSKPKASASCSA